MNTKQFFPNRVIHFIAIVALALVITSPLVYFIPLGQTKYCTLLYGSFFFIFLLLVWFINRKGIRGLLNRYSITTSIVVSALIFGLIHVQPIQIITGVFVGLLLGIVFVKTHSLLYTIILHFAANAMVWIEHLIGIKSYYAELNTCLLVAIAIIYFPALCYLTKMLSSKIIKTT